MPIVVTCTCGARHQFPDHAAGRKARCKNCGRVYLIPNQGAKEESVLEMDLLAAADEAARTSAGAAAIAQKKKCPQCGAPMPTEALLCVSCGYNIKSGRTVAGAVVPSPSPAAGAGERVCPCCQKQLPEGAKVCVECGVDAKTGRSILISREADLDRIYIAAESIIRWVSWLFPVGVYPIASEAFGLRKPHFIRAIAIITVVTSAVFLAYQWSFSPKMRELKNLMLWAGQADPDPVQLESLYAVTSYGDSDAFYEKEQELEGTLPPEELPVAAHNALSLQQQAVGQYRPSQLITHAFLHGGPVHLIGNLIFLLVLGSRVNALIGNVATLILYPLLAVAAAWAHMQASVDQPPVPLVGASGAIMGLAGMYLVLFPVHQVHMSAWCRWGLLAGFRLSLKLWPIRGFWVVIFYVAFDVFYVAFRVQDNVAHWAHLGGFIAGVVIALALLFSRVINCRGGDIISAVLGKHAWALIGKPNRALSRIPLP